MVCSFCTCQYSILISTGQIDEVNSVVRDIFAALFPLTQSPFVATALIEILTDVAEKSVEMSVEGMELLAVVRFKANFGRKNVRFSG